MAFNLVRSLLAERNLAHLQYKIKTSFPKLFRFSSTGLLFAEKSSTPFDPSYNQLYSIIMDEEEGAISPNFRLHDTNILRHSSQAGLTGLCIEQRCIMVS